MADQSQTQPAERKYDPGEEPVSSDKKYEVLAGEAEGFYRMVVTVSTAFLGGSMLFMEKLAPHPVPYSVLVLAAGWAAFLVAIFFIVDVRRKNLESLRLAMRCEYDKADIIDKGTRRGSQVAQNAMLAGMCLVAVYGLLNLASYREEPMKSQRVIVSTDDKSIPLSISGGATGPPPTPVSQPAPAPASNPDKNPPGTPTSTEKP